MNRPTATRGRHHFVAVTALLLAAAAAGCASGDTTEAKPKASASPTASPSQTYDVYDCKALMERGYAAGKVRDVSHDPECKALTRDEYVAAVGDVVAGHKDDIMADAAKTLVWDEAWDSETAARQKLVCDRLNADGAEVVGQEMKDAAGNDSSGDEVKMAQYFLDEKC
ncbi:hypothetical protein AB0M87_04545 [Streptomyces sp. NPDC051320]|uniref:hypothetical protein n=1 Tax=Streptomyces sp. NPDC051320 TaxID=3154644 RepID=UPI003425F93E